MKKNIYTWEFKTGAVKMVLEEKVSASKVARDLGISNGALSKWIQDYRKNGPGSFPGKGNLAPQNEQVRDLKVALRRAEMERDLLKKTIVIFAAAERKSISS